MPFKNKNRKLRNYSIVRLFVAVFLFVGVVSVLSFLSKFVFAAPYTEVIKSIELTSQRSSYANNVPGSWHVTKSAQWIEKGKARITFDVDTVRKTADNTYTDIIMVIDNSGSMSGDKMDQVKSDATELIESVLSNANNKIALVNFNSIATKLSGFTNNKSTLIELVNGLDTPGSTNYYDALKKAEEVLGGYTHQSNRELIMLFLTDGYPNQDSPNEVAEYRAIKQMYPYMTINGIQYEMGEEVLEPIIAVSDNQFIANMTSLNNTLFEASVAPYAYENFTITDYIDNTYWDIESVDDINANIGDTDLSFDGSIPKVTWTMNGALASGQTAQLTIDITLKNNPNLPEGSFLPTNKSETISSKLPETPDENISSTLTPVLKNSYDVIYEPNLPSDCISYDGTLPATTSYDAFETVQISTNKLSCSGYNFIGWEIAEGDPRILNDDYFKIIDDNVILRATWSRVSISKAMDGEVHEEVIATLATGDTINQTLKQLSGQSGATTSTSNDAITAIKSADSMSAAQQANAMTISDSNSAVPIYAWFDEGSSTIYIYSSADKIASGPSSLNRLFMRFKVLEDISGVSGWDTSKATSMGQMFQESSVSDLSPISGWDVSNVTNMTQTFYEMPNLVNIDALSDWDVSKVNSMQYMFRTSTNLTNIDGANNWDVSSVTNMCYMFAGNTSLSNIDGVSDWDTSRVKDMSYLFQGTSSLVDIDALSDWNTSSVTDMGGMFLGASNLANVDALAGWDTSSVEDMSEMFSKATSLANIDALAGWDTSSVKDMDRMFYNASNLTNIDGASGWDTSSVTDMQSMFSYASSLTNIDGMASWDTSSVTDMDGMFLGASSLANVDALAGWDTSSVEDMSGMFWTASNLTNIDGMASWDTSSVTDMHSMFSDASSLTNIDGASGWDTSSVTDMSNMFREAIALTNIDGASGWDTSSVTDMRSMFSSTSSLTNVSAANNWNTSGVTDMSYLFGAYYGNSPSVGITNIDGLSNWDTSSVINMERMFSQAENLTNIDALAAWDTSSVTNMSLMFNDAISLASVAGATNWDTSSVTSMRQMFDSDALITDLSPLYDWDVSSLTDMGAMFSGIPNTVTRPTWYDGT